MPTAITKSSHTAYLQSDHWKRTRKVRIEDGGNCCERCELPRWLAQIVYDQDLHVHHKHYRTKGREEYEDLEVLCRRCHEIETFGRSDLREVKSTRCETCKRKHFDLYADQCSICALLCGDGGEINTTMFFRLQAGGRDWLIYHQLLNELYLHAIESARDVDDGINTFLEIVAALETRRKNYRF